MIMAPVSPCDLEASLKLRAHNQAKAAGASDLGILVGNTHPSCIGGALQEASAGCQHPQPLSRAPLPQPALLVPDLRNSWSSHGCWPFWGISDHWLVMRLSRSQSSTSLSLQMTSVSLQKCTPTSRRTICTPIRHILTAVHRHPQHQLPMASALTSALKTQTLGERIPVRKWTRMGDSGGMRPLLHHRLPPGAWSLCVCCAIRISLSSHAVSLCLQTRGPKDL